MLNRRWTVPLLVLGVSGFAGCSSDEAARCVTGEPAAEVCITSSGGGFQVKASGLEPGSNLVIETEQTGAAVYEVGAEGSSDGAIGLLGNFDGSTVSISATAEDGQLFAGEIALGG